MADQVADRPRLLDGAELARLLGVSEATVHRLALADRIPCFRAGRQLRFDVVEVLAALRGAELPA